MSFNISFFIISFFFLGFMYLLWVLGSLQFFTSLYFLDSLKINEFWNISYIVGLDGLSILFSLLVLFLVYICLLNYKYVNYRRFWYVLVLMGGLFIFLEMFWTRDLLVYFFFFELSALPMYLMISIWGSRERKVYAGNLLVIYTMVGSLFLLLTLFFLYIYVGTLNFSTFYYYFFDQDICKLIFLLFFFSFAIKIPVVPLHLWLPEAHVEAITPGSVLLAGVVLKLSVYVYLRGLFFFDSNYIFIILISFLTYYIPSLLAIVQNDVKKIIAYASISHMGFSLFGLFSKTLIGIQGAVFMLFGHAIVASALFLSVGIVYERYKTRNIFYYGGLSLIMPLWAFFFFLFILGNVGFPGTVNFSAELMIFYGGFFYSKVFMFLAFLGMVLPLVYSLFLYVRLVYGGLNINFITYFSDLTRREFMYIFVLGFFVIYLGLYPQTLVSLLVY